MKRTSRDRSDAQPIKGEKAGGELVTSEAKPTTKTSLTVPSPNPATNLLIAEIVVLGLASLLRSKVEEGVAKASYESEEQAREVLDGRTLLSSLGLYGAARLANRSPLGLGIVAGGLIAKTLYDRGKQIQRRRHEAGSTGSSEDSEPSGS